MFWQSEKALTKNFIGEPDPYRGINELFTSAQAAVIRSIAPLLCSCCPTHITRFVVAVIVDAIKAVVTRWSRPNVREEGCKRAAPAVADIDAASAVVWIRDRLRVFASHDHRVPDRVLWRPGSSVRSESVGCLRFTTVNAQAPAALCLSGAKSLCGNDYWKATGATAQPSGPTSPVRRGRLSDYEASESLTDQIQSQSVHEVAFQAPATLDALSSEVTRCDNLRVAAFTLTDPANKSFDRCRLMKNCQATKALTLVVNGWNTSLRHNTQLYRAA